MTGQAPRPNPGQSELERSLSELELTKLISPLALLYSEQR